jgi:hypothetical protein
MLMGQAGISLLRQASSPSTSPHLIIAASRSSALGEAAGRREARGGGSELENVTFP